MTQKESSMPETKQAGPKPAAAEKPSDLALKAQKDAADADAKAAKEAREAAEEAAETRRAAAVELAELDAKEEKARAQAEFEAHERAEKVAKSGDLGPAGESTDPAVHQALAEREIARLNRDPVELAVADRRLGLLGVKA